MKKTWIADIEIFPTLFFVGIKDYKGQSIMNYEVSERRDDREALYEILAPFDGYLVTFNGLHYDEIVLKKFLKDFDKLNKLPVDKFLAEMKRFSDKTIDQDNHFDDIKWYKWYKGTFWTSIDLFCYWSKMLRLSKKISLKSLAVQISHDEIQELPYHHTQKLNLEEIDEIIRYNNRNDLGVTEKLFTKMKDDILLRNYIEKEYGIPCYSFDAPKIAGELLIKDYCEQTFDPNQHQDLEEYIREFKKTKHDYYSGTVKDIMGDFKVEFQLPEFQNLYDKMMNSSRDFSYEFPLIHEPSNTRLRMSYGIGGAHVINEDEYYQSTDYQVVTSDFASLYPNIIINWECIRFPETLEKYKNVKEDRIVAKRDKDKVKDKLLKLCLNSLSGLLDNQHSPLYYPEGALRMRIAGQLIITKLMETIMLNGWRVISLNTK